MTLGMQGCMQMQDLKMVPDLHVWTVQYIWPLDL